LRLQHAVEGLSIAAISYYVLSLSGAALRSLHAANFLGSPEAIEGILILPVILSILFIMRRKRRIIGEPHEAEPGRRGGLAEDK